MAFESIGHLLKSCFSIRRQKDPFAKVLQAGAADYGLGKVAAVSKEAMAYLWMSIEADMNIVLAGTGRSVGGMLLACSSLIPGYDKALAVTGSPLAYLSGSRNMMWADKVTDPSMECADRVVVCTTEPEAVNRVFNGTLKGTSFLAGVTAVQGQNVVRVLSEKPFGVRSELISKIDICAWCSYDTGITSITECKWFERGESELHECPEAQPFSQLDIVREGSIDRGSLGRSKSLYAYSKAYAIRRRDAVEELDKRISFLESGNYDSVSQRWLLQKLK